MTKSKLNKLIIYLKKKGYQIFGPTKNNDEILIDEIKKPNQLKLENKLPIYSFKEFFLPPKEVLFFSKKNQLKENIEKKKIALLGISIFDLKALILYRQVFEKDFYFQKRFKNTLIIGYGPAPFIDGQFKIWKENYEKNILEHLQFDLFLMKRGKTYQIFTGTRLGQEILDQFGYKNYEHIQFAGYLKEEGLEVNFLKIKEIIEKTSPSSPFWQDLGNKCIECGKCSLVCPTCFCFDIEDKLNLKDKKRIRCWTSCFYHDFSEIAGGEKFLKTTAERIYFWYYHKFVRLLNEYKLVGCVGCGRCTQVCPVKIDISKNLNKLLNLKND